jgi:hypothetical protein
LTVDRPLPIDPINGHRQIAPAWRVGANSRLDRTAS